jgi:hypothetical protein
VALPAAPGQIVFSDATEVLVPGQGGDIVSWYFSESAFPLASSNSTLGGVFTLSSNMLAGLPGYIGNGATRGSSGSTTCLMTAPITMGASNKWTLAYWSLESAPVVFNAPAVYLRSSGGAASLTFAVGTLLDGNRVYWASQLAGPAVSVSETHTSAWVHAVFVYDGPAQTITVYKNGAFLATLTGYNNTTYTHATVDVGTGFLNSGTTIAWDSLTIANTALTAAQALAVYQGGL